MVLNKENTSILELMSDNSLPKQSMGLRSRSPSSLKQKKRTERNHKRKRQITSQSVAEKKMNSEHLPSVGDDKLAPKEMHHTTCDDYSSLQPNVVVTKLKPKILQSLSDRSKSRRYTRDCHSPLSPPVEKNETEVPCGMEKLVAPTKINGHDLSASEDGDDVHPTTCNDYSSLQPRVVLTRIKPKILQSLFDHNKKSRYPRTCLPPSLPVKKKETEVLCGMEELIVPIKLNGRDLSASEEDDDGNNKLGRVFFLHHTTCRYSVLQPKVVVTRIKTKLFDSLYNNGSPNSGNCQQARLPPSLVEETETEQTVESKWPAIQFEAQIKVHVVSLVADVLDSVCNSSSPNSSKCLQAPLLQCPVEEIETEQTLRREKPEVQLEDRREICVPSSEDAEHKPQRGRTVHEESPEKDENSLEESENESVSSYEVGKEVKNLLMVQTKASDSESDQSSPGYSKRLRCRPSAPPKRGKPRPSTPPRREKPGVRLVTKKKINYCDPSSEEEDSCYHPSRRSQRTGKTEKRKPTRKDSFGSDSSLSYDSSSSSELWKPFRRREKQYKKKTNVELELQKTAIAGGEMCEYEQQRMENVKAKLAFLESLKKHEEADLESFNGFADD